VDEAGEVAASLRGSADLGQDHHALDSRTSARLDRLECVIARGDHHRQVYAGGNRLDTAIDLHSESIARLAGIHGDERALETTVGETGERLVAQRIRLVGRTQDRDRGRVEHRMKGAAVYEGIVIHGSQPVVHARPLRCC
jgi:hypothetical protein